MTLRAAAITVRAKSCDAAPVSRDPGQAVAWQQRRVPGQASPGAGRDQAPPGSRGLRGVRGHPGCFITPSLWLSSALGLSEAPAAFWGPLKVLPAQDPCSRLGFAEVPIPFGIVWESLSFLFPFGTFPRPTQSSGALEGPHSHLGSSTRDPISFWGSLGFSVYFIYSQHPPSPGSLFTFGSP